jgi:hypothetical protein
VSRLREYRPCDAEADNYLALVLGVISCARRLRAGFCLPGAEPVPVRPGRTGSAFLLSLGLVHFGLQLERSFTAPDHRAMSLATWGESDSNAAASPGAIRSLLF